MGNRQAPRKRWNIFARELENIVTARGLKLDDLAERGVVHHGKIRRLKQSLFEPKSFTTLTPIEIQALKKQVGLTPQEELHLQAAMHAVIVEKWLTDRISPDAALMAAEEVLPIIDRALQQQARGSASNTRGDVDILKDDKDDLLLTSALDALDSAHIALHLSLSATAQHEKVLYARQAGENFNAALTELDKVREDTRNLTGWQEWHTEAHTGLQTVLQRLQDLGVR